MRLARHAFPLWIALLVFGMLAPAFADRAPSWLVGTYEGYNRKYSVRVRITVKPNGEVVARGRKNNGSTSEEQGYYRSDTLIIEGKRYLIRRWGTAFRLVEAADTSNSTEYSRVSGSWDENRPGGDGDGDGDDRPGRPDPSDRVPGWLMGTFEGYNEAYDVNVELRVDRDGHVTSRGRREGDRGTTETGEYRDGKMVIGGNNYRVERRSNGFLLIEERDRSNRTQYRRLGGGFPGEGNADRPPDWLVGTFQGRNDKYDVSITLRITSDGRVTSRGLTDDGKETTETGRYQNERLIIGGNSYRVSRSGNRITLTEERDRSNRATYRRTR